MWLNAIKNILFWLTGITILALIAQFFMGQIPLPLQIHIIIVSILIIGIEIKQAFGTNRPYYKDDEIIHTSFYNREQRNKIQELPIIEETKKIKPKQKQDIKEKICTYPGCYGTMKIRTGKDSKKYWVCSDYNKCKTAVVIEEAGA